jgi:hypothetical protein
MAVTYTPNITVMSNFRVSYGLATLEAVTSGAFKTGLEVIKGGAVTRQSFTSTAGEGTQVNFNVGSGGTAINGEIRITTGTAGDDFNVFVFGN